MIRSVQFGVGASTDQNPSAKSRLETQLRNLRIGQSLRVGDPSLGRVNIVVPELGQIVEITKVSPDAETEDHFGIKLSCGYLLTIKETNFENYKPVLVNNLLLENVSLFGATRSMPGYTIGFGDIFQIELPEHQG